MYEELISRLRADEFPISEIHIWMREAADVIEELLWSINYIAICDNCKHFGGCCCDHVDENGKCLGWEVYRKPTKEDRERYDKYMEEAAKILKQILKERGTVKLNDMSGGMYDGVDMYDREWKEEAKE